MNEPDYDAMIRSALLQIGRECRVGRSVTGLAEWLLQLARDRDELARQQNGKVVYLRRLRPILLIHSASSSGGHFQNLPSEDRTSFIFGPVSPQK